MIKALMCILGLHAADVCARMPVGQYVGTVVNIYSTGAMSGISWFTVDRSGAYRGQTLARKPNGACLSHDPKGWTGQLHPIGENTFFAQNDGSSEGYVLQVTADRRFAVSSYMGAEQVVETNWFIKDNRFKPELLLRKMADQICEEYR
jgi:hypothetical protein